MDKIALFKKFNESYFAFSIDKLFNKLLEQIIFEVKIQNASIHLSKEKTTFSAIGFRKRVNYYFVEFYTDASINDKRIVKEVKRDNMYQGRKIEYIINRVEIRNENEINDKLIEWIIKSYKLMENICTL